MNNFNFEYLILTLLFITLPLIIYMITAANILYSCMCMILIFVIGIIIFSAFEAIFSGLVILMVYVGAVATLFSSTILTIDFYGKPEQNITSEKLLSIVTIFVILCVIFYFFQEYNIYERFYIYEKTISDSNYDFFQTREMRDVLHVTRGETNISPAKIVMNFHRTYDSQFERINYVISLEKWNYIKKFNLSLSQADIEYKIARSERRDFKTFEDIFANPNIPSLEYIRMFKNTTLSFKEFFELIESYSFVDNDIKEFLVEYDIRFKDFYEFINYIRSIDPILKLKLLSMKHNCEEYFDAVNRSTVIREDFPMLKLREHYLLAILMKEPEEDYNMVNTPRLFYNKVFELKKLKFVSQVLDLLHKCKSLNELGLLSKEYLNESLENIGFDKIAFKNFIEYCANYYFEMNITYFNPYIDQLEAVRSYLDGENFEYKYAIFFNKEVLTTLAETFDVDVNILREYILFIAYRSLFLEFFLSKVNLLYISSFFSVVEAGSFDSKFTQLLANLLDFESLMPKVDCKYCGGGFKQNNTSDFIAFLEDFDLVFDNRGYRKSHIIDKLLALGYLEAIPVDYTITGSEFLDDLLELISDSLEKIVDFFVRLGILEPDDEDDSIEPHTVEYLEELLGSGAFYAASKGFDKDESFLSIYWNAFLDYIAGWFEKIADYLTDLGILEKGEDLDFKTQLANSRKHTKIVRQYEELHPGPRENGIVEFFVYYKEKIKSFLIYYNIINSDEFSIVRRDRAFDKLGYAKIFCVSTDIELIGKIFYTYFSIVFIFCGFILFISIIGILIASEFSFSDSIGNDDMDIEIVERKQLISDQIMKLYSENFDHNSDLIICRKDKLDVIKKENK